MRGEVELNDSNLVIQCQSGDVDAFGLLVEKYSDKAIRTAYLITGRQDIAEDIAQEAFIQCYYSIKQLKNVEFFKTWFYKILMRTSWKMVNKANGQMKMESIDKAGNYQLSDSFNLQENLEIRQAHEAIRQGVDKLSKPLNEVIVLYYYNGFTIKEIAQVLDCREGTVKSRLFNARKVLAKGLKQKGWDVLNHEEDSLGKECHLHV